MKVGDLVRYKDSVGIVTGAVRKRWAKPADIWVLWNNNHKPMIESSDFLELLNASR